MRASSLSECILLSATRIKKPEPMQAFVQLLWPCESWAWLMIQFCFGGMAAAWTCLQHLQFLESVGCDVRSTPARGFDDVQVCKTLACLAVDSSGQHTRTYGNRATTAATTKSTTSHRRAGTAGESHFCLAVFADASSASLSRLMRATTKSRFWGPFVGFRSARSNCSRKVCHGLHKR